MILGKALFVSVEMYFFVISEVYMKKMICAILAIQTIGIIFLSACQSNEKTADTTSNNISEKYIHVDLPQIQRKNQRLYYVDWGKLTKESISDSVLVFSDEQYENKDKNNVYIVADISGEFIVQNLGITDKMVIQNGMLALTDIDGDDVDEVVIHIEISNNGGTITRIYKVEKEGFQLLSDLDQFDTGYTSSFENGYKLKITNKYTGFVESVDISNIFSSEFFDINGLAKTNESIFVKPFDTCEVKINSEGKSELYCSQIVNLSGYVGKVYTNIKYNTQTSNFEVIKSAFDLKIH